MKIIGISGSPREYGNTEVLVRGTLEGTRRELGAAKNDEKGLKEARALGERVLSLAVRLTSTK